MNIRIRTAATQGSPAVFGINADVGPNPTSWDHENQGGNLPMFSLAWTDAMAYLDWAGLRPLTELEYEKAARGELQVVGSGREFAWGDQTLGIAHMAFDDRNRATEVSGTAGANRATPSEAAITAHDATSLSRWPIRVGAFARENTTRVQAGASYWGVLNLSDNVPERYINFSTTQGQAFRGTHGDGNLTGTGHANVPCWPGQATRALSTTTGAEGTGYKGIGLSNSNNIPAWNTAIATNPHTVSAREHINVVHNSRDPWTGMRGGRSISVEFGVLAHPSVAQRAAFLSGSAATGGNGFVVLRVSAVGGEPAYTYQWFWTDMPGNTSGGTPIDGATTPSFTPPTNVAHTERYFYCVITDSEGSEIVTEQSGPHTVLAIETSPSTTTLSTSLTQGTQTLSAQHTGGAGPFTYQWFFLLNGTAGAAGTTGGTLIPGATGQTYHPTIPIPGNNYTFFAIVTDAMNVATRTNQSGIHIASSGQHWVGSGATGTIQSVTLAPGVYRLEAWGASGGRGHINTSAHANSNNWGGYTQAYLTVTTATEVFIAAGGAGAHGYLNVGRIAIPGGWNGGGPTQSSGDQAGRTMSGGSGGGASHISLASGTLDVEAVRTGILIAAGGGGGGAWTTSSWEGGRGGGVNGETRWTPHTGGAGTASAGGAAGAWNSTPAANRIVQPTAGTAGQGGRGAGSSTTWGASSGGGGGGWFGGGGGAEVSNYSIGGGGGSGRVGPATNGIIQGAHMPSAPGPGTFLVTTSNGSGGVNQPGSTAEANTPVSPAGRALANSTQQGAVRIIRLR